MMELTFITFCFLGVAVAIIFQLMHDLEMLRLEVRNAIRGVVTGRSPHFHWSRSREIWRSVLMAFRGRRAVEREGREVLSDVLTFGSRIAEVSYAKDEIVDGIVAVLLERAGADIVALAVALRSAEDNAIRIERVEGLPQQRIELPLLMAFDELLDGGGVSWGYHGAGEGGVFDFSAFGVDLSLSVPLRSASGICGVVWLGFRRGSQVLSSQKRALVEGLTRHVAATFHASQQIEERTRATTSQRDLLLGMSHDLRAPGNSALFALSDVLSGECGALSVQQEEKLRVIELALRDQMELLGDVLDVAKAERGCADVIPVSFSLRECAERVISSVKPAAERAGVIVSNAVSPELTVCADARHVQRILWNLLSNAVKYAPDSTVVVAADTENGTLELSVTDSGVGVPVEERERLFTQFGRLSNSKSEQGVGIGLTLVRALAQQNGGEAFYRPGPERGSTFGICIPAAVVAHTDSSSGSSFSGTVVVVDDDPAACRAVIRMLRGCVERLVPAGSVSEAVELCLSLQPDAVVTDYHLSDGTAQELFESLRKQGMTVAGVVLTGSSDPDLRLRLQSEFNVPVLEKPVSAEALVVALGSESPRERGDCSASRIH